MPHLILEVSANVIETNDKLKHTLSLCHVLLVDKISTKLENCKGRILLHDLVVFGDNNSGRQAFAHLSVKMLKGRSAQLLKETACQLKAILQGELVKSIEHLNLDISVEIVELSDYYV